MGPRSTSPRRAVTRRTRWWRRERTWKVVCLTALVAMTGAGGTYVWRSGTPSQVGAFALEAYERALFASARFGLAVHEILVEGRDETAAADILAAIEARRGAPIFTFSPGSAKAELEKLPWVAHAAVERRLPDVIYVRLVERRPLALWQRDGRMSVIDREGTEIRGADIGRFAGLPLVVGSDAARNAAALLALLATEPDVEKRVGAAIRVGGRRWTLRLDNGVDVHLPEINPGAAWARFAELVRGEGLLERNVTVVDLRLSDRLILRTLRETPPPVPAKASRSSGRPT